MVFSIKTQKKIKKLFKNDSEIIEQLLSGNAEVISKATRKIGGISQEGIDPEDVVVAFESNDSDTMNYLYNQSKRLIELQELYQELCSEFCDNMINTTTTEYSTEKKRSV